MCELTRASTIPKLFISDSLHPPTAGAGQGWLTGVRPEDVPVVPSCRQPRWLSPRRMAAALVRALLASANLPIYKHLRNQLTGWTDMTRA